MQQFIELCWIKTHTIYLCIHSQNLNTFYDFFSFRRLALVSFGKFPKMTLILNAALDIKG